MFKLVVSGSRNIKPEYGQSIFKWLDGVLAKHPDLHIFTGGAKGVDAIANAWTTMRGSDGYNVELTVLPAEWDRHGKRAGFIRNEELADCEPDGVACFTNNWELTSGTAHMIDVAIERNIPWKHMHHGTNK